MTKSSSKTSSRRELIWLVLVATVLIGAVVLVRTNAREITRFIEANPILGGGLYLVLNILDAVIAPGATLPLIPVAAHAWGRVPAALVTVTGWTVGSLIAFLIARRWGYPIVRKLTSVERVKKLKPYVPNDVFWSVVLLRLVMPMDVISYVAGLFTDMSISRYVIATLLGLTPTAFLLAYLGKLPHAYDLIMFGIGGAVVAAYFLFTRRRTSRATAHRASHA